MAITRLTDFVTVATSKWTYGDSAFKYEGEVNQDHDTIYPLMIMTPPSSRMPDIYEGFEHYNVEMEFYNTYQTAAQNAVTLQQRWDNLQDLALEWLDNVLIEYSGGVIVNQTPNKPPTPTQVYIDKESLNVSAESFIKKITKKTKVIMLINVLGISGNIEKIVKIAKKKNIIIIEDNCEALGAKLNNKFLGTYGNFGTFSFFYSHQITSGEGGMIVCNEKKDYEILLALRSHGWSRGPNSYKINAKKFPSLDPRYIFINMGFNLRPTEIQASIARNQFSRFEKLRSIRTENRKKIIENIINDKRFKNQFSFIKIPKNIKPSFMGLPIIINKKFTNIKKKFVYELEKKGLETRPIISGSFVNQPSVSLFKLNPKKEKFLNAESIQKNGFLIGLHTKKIKKNELNFLVNTLFLIDKL